MALDANVGLYLCDEWPDPAWAERVLADVNTTLRANGRPEHHEPRTVDDPDPCGLGVRLGFYGSEKYQRLSAFGRYLAVFGLAPTEDRLWSDVVEDAYDALPDRRLAFDHVIAAVGLEVVVLPQDFGPVLWGGGGKEFSHLVSAPRLRVESVALGYALRNMDDPDIPAPDESTRIEERAAQSWADEGDLCHRLRTLADTIIRTGALAITG